MNNMQNNIDKLIPQNLNNETKLYIEALKLQNKLINNRVFINNQSIKIENLNKLIIKHNLGISVIAVCYTCNINTCSHNSDFNQICACPDIEFQDINYWKRIYEYDSDDWSDEDIEDEPSPLYVESTD
tara:strand:- start:199 stop:582 length:384 start_codon:yes stop_codon:yes gene_type:complete